MVRNTARNTARNTKDFRATAVLGKIQHGSETVSRLTRSERSRADLRPLTLTTGLEIKLLFLN
jgi:hypothetical protein